MCIRTEQKREYRHEKYRCTVFWTGDTFLQFPNVQKKCSRIIFQTAMGKLIFYLVCAIEVNK